jgi:hypothetical protein
MRLSTGIDALDRVLGGGIPAGSLVVVTSPPEAQVDPLLNAGIHERPTHYFTTIRDPSAVRDELDRHHESPKIASIRHVGVDGGLEDILSEMETLQPGEDVIVSVLDPLETATQQTEFVSFCNYFVKRLQETDSLGIVHCLDVEDPPSNRNYTLAAADFVFQLRYEPTGSKLVYRLEIPKASGLSLSEEERVLALNLGQTVSVDTSRDIA